MSPVISIRGLEVQFRGCHALKGIDLEIPSGVVHALLGENGAGKTTLIRVLTGFQRPTSGACSVMGLDPVTQADAIRRSVGYVSDAPVLYDWMRVAEIGWFAAAFYAGDFQERYRELISHYEVPESRKIKQLSKGQRAKVALALALAHDPQLLILDEPTSGLDPIVRREFLESMMDRVATGRTVLLSSHQINEVERVADSISLIHNGKLRVNGLLDDLRTKVNELIINVDDPLRALPRLPLPTEVLLEETRGRQRRLLLQDLTEESRTELETFPGVSGVTVRNASLDDIFLAFTRGTSQSSIESSQSSSEARDQGVTDVA